jgi:predicted alpha/beta superfamily hydrolase
MWKYHGAWLVLSITTCMSAGKLLPEEKVASRFLGETRTVRIYLPPSYEAKPARRYAVLYLHDGQNVFSSAGTNCCFGWGNWELDRTVDRLCAKGRMQEIIMVAIDNSRARYKEYRGRLHAEPAKGKKIEASTNAMDNARFDSYANFLIEELKPKIDRKYRTLKTAADTGVLGSSLGGICSLSLAWEFPKVFGRAASLSGAFQVEKRNFIEQALRPWRSKPKSIRVYLDSGTADFTGDDDGRKHTNAVAEELRRIGWKEDRNLKHFTDLAPVTESEMERAGLRRDKWHEAQKSQHNEFYWRLRVWWALEFLFPAKRREPG